MQNFFEKIPVIYKKSVADNTPVLGKLLYLMGATWHTKSMFDLDSDEDSFADILSHMGIETYAFDNLPAGHTANVGLAVDLIAQFGIDYVMGYSYGCLTAYDVARQTNIKGLVFLDPVSTPKVKKRRVGDFFEISKASIESALIENNTSIADNIRIAHINALSTSDTLMVPTYPVTKYRESDCFGLDMFAELNIKMFLTSQSTEESRTWSPSSTYYPNSSHWIMLEAGRYALAHDVVNFFKGNKNLGD
jgi:hypothetical protein